MGEQEQARYILLVPVDFQDAASSALAFAEDLASRLGAEIVLMHVYKVLVQPYPGLSPAETAPWPGIHLEVAEAAKRALDALSEAHGGLRSILAEGDPAPAILDEVTRLRPRMVIMGTHGRSGIEHLMLGSVAEKVVRRCLVPVTVVRAA